MVVTALAALLSIKERISVESHNEATTLAMEMSILEGSAAGDVGGLLARAKQAGLGAVVLSEETIGEALDEGKLWAVPTDAGITVRGIPSVVARVKVVLDRRAPKSYINLIPDQSQGLQLVNVSLETIRGYSLGIDPDRARVIVTAGLPIIARHSNGFGLDATEIAELLKLSKARGAIGYLPEGEQVLGQRGLVKETAELLAQLQLNYYSPEFAKIAGDTWMAELCEDRLIRLHSMQSAEVDKASPAEYVERYSKAARERNIRTLLLRPVTTASAASDEPILESLRLVRSGLGREGVAIGPAKPFGETEVPRVLKLLIAAGGALVAVWLGQTLFRSFSLQVAIGVMALLAAAASQVPSVAWVPAFLAALIFPVAAIVWLESRERVSPWLCYLVLTAISLVGGLSIAGILNGRAYFLHIDEFSGVKAAHFLPLLVIGVYLLQRRVSMRALLAKPATWLGIVAGLGALVVVSMLLARTGNDNPAAVSGLELKLRSLLDWVLYTRPRTKEFLIGHPAMVVGLMLLALGHKRESKGLELAAVACITVGTIALTSVVNTLCHLHTPILLGLARIGIGWVIGGLFGYALWLVLRRLVPTLREAN